jgi:integrase
LLIPGEPLAVPTITFTDAVVRNLKPPAADAPQRQVNYFHTLERGLALVLKVSYGGTKAWFVTTYRNGKARSHKLGVYPAMKLKEANRLARAYYENPAVFEAKAAVGTFQEVADNWIKRHVEGRLRTAREIKRQLDYYVYPQWKNTPFLEIRRKEVNALLDRIVDKHGRPMADAVLTTLRSLMTWQQARDENYTSPIVRGMKRNHGAARTRILSDDELRAVWTAADRNWTFGAVIKVLLLTAQRREKVRAMKWDDLKDGVWTIANEEREKGTAGKLTLPASALAIINMLPRTSSYVFPGRGGKALTGFSDGKRILDRRLGNAVAEWRLHDLRRTARSLMSRAGVAPHIAERVLGHALRGVEKTYDRFAYDREKAEALQRLADLVETILHPPAGNVVALRA